MKIMRKNRIRLTESDLRRIVNKSVKKILRESKLLNELDWKTYRNAQEKALERDEEYKNKYWELERKIQKAYDNGDTDTANRLKKKQEAIVGKGSLRAMDFGFSSNRAFNDKFFNKSYKRFNDADGKTYAPLKSTDDGSYSTHEPWIDGTGNIHGGRFFPGHGKVDGKFYDDIIGYGTLDDHGEFGYNEMNGNDRTSFDDDELEKLGFPPEEINDIEKARREIRRYRNGDYYYKKGEGWELNPVGYNG